MITDNLKQYSILRHNNENYLYCERCITNSEKTQSIYKLEILNINKYVSFNDFDMNCFFKICFNTSILDSSQYITINNTQIIFIPSKDYYDVNNKSLKYVFSYDYAKDTWDENERIDFRDIITGRVSTFDEIKLLMKHALLRNFPIKYKDEYYFSISIDMDFTKDKVLCRNFKTLKEKNIDLCLNKVDLVYDDIEMINARMIYSMHLYIKNKACHLEDLPQVRKFYKITYKTDVGERTTCVFTHYDNVLTKNNNIHVLFCEDISLSGNTGSHFYIPINNIIHIEETKVSKEIYKKNQIDISIDYEIGDVISYLDKETIYYCIFKGWADKNYKHIYVYGLMHDNKDFFHTYIIDIEDTCKLFEDMDGSVQDYKMLCAIKLKCNGMKYNETDLPLKNAYYQIGFMSDNGIIKHGIIKTEENYIIDNNIVYFFCGDNTPHLVNYNSLISISTYHVNETEPVNKEKKQKKSVLKADFSNEVKQSVNEYKGKHRLNLIAYSYIVYKSNQKEDYWKLGQYAYENEDFVYFIDGGYINKKFYTIMPIEKYSNEKKLFF